MNPLPQGLRTALGRANCVLGREGILGRHYPATQRRIRIILEPRNAAQCAALQPHQAGGSYLQKLLALALGPRTLDCEVEYHLHKSAAVPTLLHGGCSLGVNALLCRNGSSKRNSSRCYRHRSGNIRYSSGSPASQYNNNHQRLSSRCYSYHYVPRGAST